jgi:hypothetical protein
MDTVHGDNVRHKSETGGKSFTTASNMYTHMVVRDDINVALA